MQDEGEGFPVDEAYVGSGVYAIPFSQSYPPARKRLPYALGRGTKNRRLAVLPKRTYTVFSRKTWTT